MSLLLQALQKAAKNRELNQRGEPAAGDLPPTLTNDLDIPASAFEVPTGPSIEIEPGDIEPPQRTVEREPRRIEAIPEPEPVPTPQQAAAVIGAATLGREAKFNPLRWAIDHPVPALLGIVVPAAIAYGAYVFIAVTNPGFFTRNEPTLTVGAGNAQRIQSSQGAPQNRVASAETTAPSAPMPELPSTTPSPTGVPSTPATATSTASAPNTAAPASTASAPKTAATTGSTASASGTAAGTTAVAAAGVATSKEAAAQTGNTEAAPKPMKPVAPVVADATEIKSPAPMRPTKRQSAGAVDREAAAAATASRKVKPLPPAEVEPVKDEVQVKASDSGGNLTALLNEGYQSLEAGQLEKARESYGRALAMDGRNTDALLGLAAADWQAGDTERASGRYYRVLEIDPQNADAQAGLIAMLGRVDPVSSETRLKQLIAREPSAGLYFALGNLYSQQGQWSSAQQSYFQALQLDASHPDYNYNLAVSLEHIGQRKIALDYYRKATELAKARGHAGFDRGLAASRITQLSQSQ